MSHETKSTKMKKFFYIALIAMIGSLPLTGNAQIFNQPAPSSTGSSTNPPPFAQTDPPPIDPFTDTPIDGGVIFLIIVGVALSIKKLSRRSAFA